MDNRHPKNGHHQAEEQAEFHDDPRYNLTPITIGPKFPYLSPMSILSRKSIDAVIESAESQGKGMKKTLGPINLVALGIGAVIGAGIFVRTAEAAGEAAGPAVVVSFIIAGIA